MKSSEIKVGMELLQARGNDWDDKPWNCSRVKVLNTKVAHWYRNSKTGNQWQDNGYKSDYSGWGGTSRRTTYGVIVQLLDKETGAVQGEKIVTLASLRGEWEPTWKAVKERREKAEKLRLDTAAAHKKRTQEADSAAKWAKVLGLEGVYASGTEVKVPVAVLNKLLDALAIMQQQENAK